MRVARLAFVFFSIFFFFGHDSYASSPNVKTDKTMYQSGDTIQVTFSGAPGLDSDWICVVPDGSNDTEGGNYKYMPAGQNSGIIAFHAEAPGKYEVRAYFNYNNIGYKVTARSSFSVSGNPENSTSSESSTPESLSALK